ncbi:hypothetical protein Mapa_002385 [Marchantia paleacea]|nr:hypothetical protein Mapa_002385 [Marchantia paleacea]
MDQEPPQHLLLEILPGVYLNVPAAPVIVLIVDQQRWIAPVIFIDFRRPFHCAVADVTWWISGPQQTNGARHSRR